MDNLTSLSFLYGFVTARYTEACAALGLPVVIRYGKATDKDRPVDDQYWARVTRQIISQDQETLRNGDNLRRFCTIGTVYVQLFGPVTDSKAVANQSQIAEMLLTGFRHYQGDDIEFTNPWINDNVASEPNWIRANVVSNFAYRQFIS